MIAIDAMGGDFAPREILAGVRDYLHAGGAQKLCLFGPQQELLGVDSRVTIVDSPECIGMGDEPVRAVREKRHSSLVMAVQSVAEKKCTAVISAGNSGAVMAAALLYIGRKKGVERPALIGLLPALRRPVVCLDLGANPDCKAKHLHQFAWLGADYAKKVIDAKNPRVGLLSNGEEPTKGSLLTKEAFALLENDPSINFIGNIEPIHILMNKADVVVCDGFAGNVLLKTVEAMGEIAQKEILKRAQHGGALLIGIKEPVVIMHGNSTAKDVVHAIEFTQDVIETWRAL